MSCSSCSTEWIYMDASDTEFVLNLLLWSLNQLDQISQEACHRQAIPTSCPAPSSTSVSPVGAHLESLLADCSGSGGASGSFGRARSLRTFLRAQFSIVTSRISQRVQSASLR